MEDMGCRDSLMLWKLGVERRSCGNLIGALIAYTSVHKIIQCTASYESLQYARLLTSIGVLLCDVQDFKHALRWYMRSYAIRARTDTLETPDGGILCMNIG